MDTDVYKSHLVRLSRTLQDDIQDEEKDIIKYANQALYSFSVASSSLFRTLSSLEMEHKKLLLEKLNQAKIELARLERIGR